MALFSLLIAIMVERLKLLPLEWQFDHLLAKYHKGLFGDRQLEREPMMFLALILPALTAYILIWAVSGLFWGAVSLLVWVVIAILCFCHQKQRQAFKHYIKAACRGDAQACYHFATELDAHSCADSVCESELGAKVGESAAWINYRYYGVIALFLIILGPVGAILYCTVRYYSEYSHKQSLSLPLVDALLHVLDWLPSRIFAFGYVLSGQFTQALPVWRKKALDVNASAREIVIDVAISAEDLPEVSPAPVCVQSTLALLQLSKRNFILIVTMLSLLTIFGVVS